MASGCAGSSPALGTILVAILVRDVYDYAPVSDAGWSSLVARRAHNPKVVGSNPAPATTF